jgi:hypothetical protein
MSCGALGFKRGHVLIRPGRGAVAEDKSKTVPHQSVAEKGRVCTAWKCTLYTEQAAYGHIQWLIEQ